MLKRIDKEKSSFDCKILDKKLSSLIGMFGKAKKIRTIQVLSENLLSVVQKILRNHVHDIVVDVKNFLANKKKKIPLENRNLRRIFVF